MKPPATPQLVPRVLAVLLYGLAFGWLEAVVVVYIRALIGIGPGQGPPDSAEALRRFAEIPWLLPTEQGREAATILMLAAVGVLAARRWSARFGAFLVAFGTWDITYYVALWIHLRWPPSLMEPDLLFLLPPHPWWTQPVIVPVAISCGFIAGGTWLMVRERG